MLFLIIMPIIILILLSIDWITHISMTKDDSNRYGFAGFKDFKREFDKIDWRYDSTWNKSLFGINGSKNYFHANIIKFNGDGMILHNPISLFIAKQYAYKQIRNKFEAKRNTVKWKNRM